MMPKEQSPSQSSPSGESGGTYGQDDQSQAARRSEARTEQHPKTSAEPKLPEVKQGYSALP
jgi:hypothetical protein